MFDLQHLVDQCRAALADQNPAQRVEALVKEAISRPAEVRDAFASVERQGPISFACHDATLSVADVTTSPGLRTPAHNHKMWAVIGVYDGQEHNRFYQCDDGELQEKSERLLKQGDVVVLGPEAIHAIANPLPTESSAIHVYGGDLVERPGRSMWNPHTNDREDYDIKQLIEYVKELSSSP